MKHIFCENINWNDKANGLMGLLTMIDTYLITDSMEIPLIKYKPCDITPTNKRDIFCLNIIYEEHKELLLDIIEIFFPNLLFTPSKINQNGSKEFYLFKAIEVVHDIVWFNNIEKSRPRGYEHFRDEINKAIYTLTPIGDSKMIKASLEYPLHRNETLTKFEKLLSTNYKQPIVEAVVKIIKNYFGIVTLTATKKQKILNSNKEVIKSLKRQGWSNEDIKKIPIIGQFQTEL